MFHLISALTKQNLSSLLVMKISIYPSRQAYFTDLKQAALHVVCVVCYHIQLQIDLGNDLYDFFFCAVLVFVMTS